MQVAHGRNPGKRRRPTMAEWDRDDELLATLRDVADRIVVALANQNRAKGQSAARFRPEPRPRSAADRAELMADLGVVADIVSQATPWAEPPRRT